MFRHSTAYGLAALFVFISAVLHLIAPFVSGFSAAGWQLVPFGIVYVAIGYGLMRGMRWLAWLTLFVMMAGGIAALGAYFGVSAVPAWLYLLIVVADWLAAACLFAILWMPKRAAA